MGNYISFIIIGLAIVAMYFLMIRPQKKQQRAEAEMRNSLGVGDEVTTIGGIVGRVVAVKEETVTIETSKDKTKIRFVKAAIRSVDVKAADAKAAKKAAMQAANAPAPKAVEEAPLKEAAPKKAKKEKKQAEEPVIEVTEQPAEIAVEPTAEEASENKEA